MPYLSSLEIRSCITAEGTLRLSLQSVDIGEPADDEIIVRMEAAPLNPADVILLLGPADLKTLRASGSGTETIVEADIPASAMTGLADRVGSALPVGNEGAGTVVQGGRDVIDLVGRVVALRAAPGTFAQYQRVKAAQCMVLPKGAKPSDGASAFINPLTALGMVETMRQEHHTALVHTAAASNLGQMLNRLCIRDKVPLVNIVRSAAQESLLRDEGAKPCHR